MKGTGNRSATPAKEPRRSKYRRPTVERPPAIKEHDPPWFVEAKETRLLEAILDEIEPLLSIAAPYEQTQPYEEFYNLLVDMRRGLERWGVVYDADFFKIADPGEALPRYVKMHAQFIESIKVSTSASECTDLQNKADKAAWRAWQCHRAAGEPDQGILMNYVKGVYAQIR
jgi:hypothetical protein